MACTGERASDRSTLRACVLVEDAEVADSADAAADESDVDCELDALALDDEAVACVAEAADDDACAELAADAEADCVVADCPEAV